MKLRILLVAFVLSVAALVNAQDSPAFNQGGRLSMPVLVKEVKPQYTPEARAAKIEGEVQMSAVVLADGTVGDVKVTRSLDSKLGLDDEAVKAAKQWLFEPGKRDGKPVAVSVTIQMAFTLKTRQ